MITRKQLISKKGKITINSDAYIDGRDFWSFPPLTIPKIRMYKDYNRSKTIRSLNHATRVHVIEYKEGTGESKMGMYKIALDEKLKKTGWISELALTNSFPTVLGIMYKGRVIK